MLPGALLRAPGGAEDAAVQGAAQHHNRDRPSTMWQGLALLSPASLVTQSQLLPRGRSCREQSPAPGRTGGRRQSSALPAGEKAAWGPQGSPPSCTPAAPSATLAGREQDQPRSPQHPPLPAEL